MSRLIKDIVLYYRLSAFVAFYSHGFCVKGEQGEGKEKKDFFFVNEVRREQRPQEGADSERRLGRCPRC